jgi:hypothetical protein
MKHSAIALGFLALTMAACSGADEVENAGEETADETGDAISDTDAALDCADICEYYFDCQGGGFSEEECSDSCENLTMDDDNEDLREQADDCDDCIDDRMCSESTACDATCAVFVPTL